MDRPACIHLTTAPKSTILFTVLLGVASLILPGAHAQPSEPVARLVQRYGWQALRRTAGGKAYHGLEMNVNANFKSNESLRMGMISYSVSQIGEFIQNDGREKK